ncbi:MAG: putative GNAT family N-acyltransferase [Verrucomicrobiales bacterium]|jgi:predicted GNAT family N-acyltransferase
MRAEENRIQFRKIAHLSDAYAATVQLRDRLLRAPLGLEFTPDELAAEFDDTHLAGFDSKGELAACLVLTPVSTSTSTPGTLRMRQVAVAPQWQRQGIGSQLVQFAETIATDLNASRLTLHAREDVLDFYQKLGYEKVGTPFTEIGIFHIAMEKALSKGVGPS